MAAVSVIPKPASIPGDQRVLIRGGVLREIRRALRLRLIDVAGGQAAVTRLSRAERQTTYRLPTPILNSVLTALCVGTTFIDAETWDARVRNAAVRSYTTGDFPTVRRAVAVLGLVVKTHHPETRLLAEAFAARSVQPQVPSRTAEIMSRLSHRAEHEEAWPAAAWAFLFESEAHEARNDHEAALAASLGAVGIPHTEETALPLLCLGAAAARSFGRCGQPADGFLILEAVPIGVSHPFAITQLARAAAIVHDVSGAGPRAAMCLEYAAEVAMTIPNPGLCAEIREDLARFYARDGRNDLASVERLRAAALSRRAGHIDHALALMDLAIGAK